MVSSYSYTYDIFYPNQIWIKIQVSMKKPLLGFEPMTYALPWHYSTTELKGLKTRCIIFHYECNAGIYVHILYIDESMHHNLFSNKKWLWLESK